MQESASYLCWIHKITPQSHKYHKVTIDLGTLTDEYEKEITIHTTTTDKETGEKVREETKGADYGGTT